MLRAFGRLTFPRFRVLRSVASVLGLKGFTDPSVFRARRYPVGGSQSLMRSLSVSPSPGFTSSRLLIIVVAWFVSSGMRAGVETLTNSTLESAESETFYDGSL